MRDRLGGKRPALSVARKLARRCYHTPRELGDQAWLAPAHLEQQAAIAPQRARGGGVELGHRHT